MRALTDDERRTLGGYMDDRYGDQTHPCESEFEAGWLAAKKFYDAAYPQQAEGTPWTWDQQLERTFGESGRRAAEADRDRLEQEVIELHDRFNQDSDRIWTLEGERDRLQRENEQLKTLMRYGSEKCHDALRGLVRAVDRFGWLTGRSMESRDTLLAKARDALGEGPGRKQSY